MQGHTVGYSTHSVLTNAEVHVVATIFFESIVTVILQGGLGRWSQVC